MLSKFKKFVHPQATIAVKAQYYKNENKITGFYYFKYFLVYSVSSISYPIPFFLTIKVGFC